MLKTFIGDGCGQGRVCLAIATLERFELEDGSVGLITRTELAPPSRHLTARPAGSASVASGSWSRKRGKRAPNYRQTTLSDAMAAAGAAARAGASTEGQPQQAQGPGAFAFAFPALAAVPGGSSLRGEEAAAAAAAAADVTAEALFPRQEAAAAAAATAASAASMPSIEPEAPRRRAAAAATGRGSEAGGAPSEAFGTGDRGQWGPLQPPVPPVGAKGGDSGGGDVYDGPLTLDSEDWAGFLEEDAAGFGGSPVPMEEVFKDG